MVIIGYSRIFSPGYGRDPYPRRVCMGIAGYYCIVGQYETRNVLIAPARRDQRKSKFGPRHGIKLIEVYAMTKSEF